MYRWIILLLLIWVNSILFSQPKELTLPSPDGHILVTVNISSTVFYQAKYDSICISAASEIGLITNRHNGSSLTYKQHFYSQIKNRIFPPVQEKKKIIEDNYTELVIEFNEPFTLEWRIYNDGIAYRWLSHFTDSLLIKNEIAEINFCDNHKLYFNQVVKRQDQDIFHTSFEEPYSFKPLDSIGNESLLFSPILIMPEQGPRIILTESDLDDYPGMFFTGNNTHSLKGVYAPYPLEEKITGSGFQQSTVTKRADYIALTRGNRSYPWRIIGIAKRDKDIPENDLVYRLGAPSKLSDHTWIKPGKGTDEWIININLFNIPFKAGINTATYKYYIDFAKRFGFDRIMMDAGWSDARDLFKITPELDMNEISAYAKAKGIKLSMWTLAITLEEQLIPALDQFKKWGVDFIMTDFMDRDDQKMVNFYHRIAEACAKYKIMVMFHGAFKPAGFSRTWPHAITREGVLGSEYNIWSEKATPEHNLILPFTRMFAGPMDYEPGILDNANKQTFRPIGSKVMAPGTRCHQLAMFVVYESPIQIFSGNPSQGIMEPRFMELLGSIPTTWDTTIVLDAKIGEYIITARKKNKDWYIGGMTDWTPRMLSIDLSFLGNGVYSATSCEDGINAEKYPADYIIKNTKVNKNQKLEIKMAPGGGYLMLFKPVK